MTGTVSSAEQLGDLVCYQLRRLSGNKAAMARLRPYNCETESTDLIGSNADAEPRRIVAKDDATIRTRVSGGCLPSG